MVKPDLGKPKRQRFAARFDGFVTRPFKAKAFSFRRDFQGASGNFNLVRVINQELQAHLKSE